MRTSAIPRLLLSAAVWRACGASLKATVYQGADACSSGTLSESAESLKKAPRRSRLSLLLALFLPFFLNWSYAQSAPQVNQEVYYGHDNSDWWSLLRDLDSESGVKVQTREFPPATFTILGIPLGKTQFTRAVAKLGAARTIQRGDAATGREQLCYVSQGNGEKVHLVIEQGELESVFYLFVGGPDWYGSDRCVQSTLVRRDVATGVGLRLGQSPAEVIAILGKPTKLAPSQMIYSFSVKKRTSPQDLADARRRNPEMSEKQIQDDFGAYYLGAFVLAKFEAGKLTYLAVSKGEST